MQLNCNFDSLIVKINCQSAKTQKQRLLSFLRVSERRTRSLFHDVTRFTDSTNVDITKKEEISSNDRDASWSETCPDVVVVVRALISVVARATNASGNELSNEIPMALAPVVGYRV